MDLVERRSTAARAGSCLPTSGDAGEVCFVGASVAVRDLLDRALTAAQWGDGPILITGATGSGKTLLARYICTRRAPAVRCS